MGLYTRLPIWARAYSAAVATPVLTSISSGVTPTIVRAAGGDDVILTGSNLSGATVQVGNDTAGSSYENVTPTANTSGSVTFLMPARTASTTPYPIRVQTAGGTSNVLTIEVYSLLNEAASLLCVAPPVGTWGATGTAVGAWASSASAGTSGSAGNITHATPALVGTAVNGFTPVEYPAGASAWGQHASNMSTFVSATEGTILAFGIIDTLGANNATVQNNQGLVTMASSANLGMVVSVDGLRVYGSDGAVKTPASAVPFTTGDPHTWAMRWSGGTLKGSVDANAGTEQSVALGSIVSLAFVPRFARNSGGTIYSNGRRHCYAMFQNELSLSTIAKAHAWLKLRHKLL